MVWEGENVPIFWGEKGSHDNFRFIFRSSAGRNNYISNKMNNYVSQNKCLLRLFLFQLIHSNNRFELLYQYLKVEKYSLVDTYAVKEN